MAIGFDVGGTLGVVVPDRGQKRNNKPRVFVANFGDGYEQRIANGINSLEQTIDVAFTTRPKADIDDIVAFFESKGGVTNFNFTLSDSNAGGSEETIKVVCDTWDQTWVYDDYYTLNAQFRRVYEA
jgi:phage-related protein